MLDTQDISNTTKDAATIPNSKEPKSAALEDWEDQKSREGARNKHLDTLFETIGMEKVKSEFLAIKAKIDTSLRQGVNLKNERFHAVLLGNPGTGIHSEALVYWCCLN